MQVPRDEHHVVADVVLQLVGEGQVEHVVWGDKGAASATGSAATQTERLLKAAATVVVLGGVGAGGQLGGGRRWEDQDVGAGGVLGRVELRGLQVERRAAAKHRAHGHRVCTERAVRNQRRHGRHWVTSALGFAAHQA